MFVEVSKQVFFEVAYEELDAGEKRKTISRISVMTGLHRKDVDRLRQGDRKSDAATDVFTRVLGQWQNDKRFSRAGNPRALNLGGGSGEFAELVQSVSKEHNPYTVLFELERLGFIKRSGDRVLLLAQEYSPRGDAEKAFELVANDIEDVVGAAEENTFDPTEVPSLHLTTRYDNVLVEELPNIRAWLMEEGDKFHKRAREYLSKFDLDLNQSLAQKSGGGRVVFGTFGRALSPARKVEQ